MTSTVAIRDAAPGRYTILFLDGTKEVGGRGDQADAAARSRLDALIDQVVGIDFAQPLQREGWAQ